MFSRNDYTFKIVFAGDSGVGKTSLIDRYTEGSYLGSYISTLGIDYKTKSIKIDEKSVHIVIWDTAGQERFRNLAPPYYRNSEGIIIVFDLTSDLSLKNAKKWIQDIEKFTNEDINKILVGNKSDLQCTVNITEAKELAKSSGMQFIETSAKSGSNVDDMILILATEIKNRIDNKNINSIGPKSLKFEPIQTDATTRPKSSKLEPLQTENKKDNSNEPKLEQIPITLNGNISNDLTVRPKSSKLEPIQTEKSSQDLSARPKSSKLEPIIQSIQTEKSSNDLFLRPKSSKLEPINLIQTEKSSNDLKAQLNGSIFSYKILLVGDARVGKSSLIKKFKENIFTEDYTNTLEVYSETKTIEINETDCKLEIWDTPGIDLKTVLPNYYPIVDGILIVYDSTNKDSFQNVRKYLNEIKTMSNIHVNKLLVGNKCDLISNKVINFENAKELADEFYISLFETSAKESINTDELFIKMVKDIQKRNQSKANNFFDKFTVKNKLNID